MSQQESLYPWSLSVASHFPSLSKPLVKGLALSSWGIARAESCRLSAVAEALPLVGKPDTVERRLQRFLANEHLDWQEACVDLSRWVFESVTEAERIVLLVDETSLHQFLKVMAVSLAYQGRAIPLAWWCYPQEAYPMKQVALIHTLLSWIKPTLPKGLPVLVEADRGMGTSPALLEAISSMEWDYLVRVQGQVRLLLEGGQEVAFSEMVPQKGPRWKAAVHAFKKAGWTQCWAVGVWEEKQEEPWLLLTNSPQAEGNWYALRMWEEMAFRDFKSNGWQWHRSHVRMPDHANRLWLAMALAYAWMLSLGTYVRQNESVQKEVTRGRWLRESAGVAEEETVPQETVPQETVPQETVPQETPEGSSTQGKPLVAPSAETPVSLRKRRIRRQSVFRLGLRFFKRWVDLDRHLFYDLWLMLDFPVPAKSVV